MPNPWILLAFVLALIAAGLGGEYDGNKRGINSERVAWQAKDNKELADANTKILQLENDARAKEQAHADALASIATNYEQELQNAENTRKADVTAARSGALRLRDPGSHTEQACGGSPGQTATASGGRDGQAGGELSPELAEFLVSEADRADTIVLQLGACQAVIVADRVP
jgi:prophage endopeptidase